MIKLMKIGLWLSELAGDLVVGWTWIFAWHPVLTSKPGLSIKYSASSSSVSWEHISSACYSSILIGVLSRAGRRFYLRKSGKFAINCAKFGVRVFTNPRSACISFEINWLIFSWTWCVISHFGLINHVNSLGTKGVLLLHASLHLVLILCNNSLTLPGPGLRWIWGIRYDLSGDLSLEQPKLTPLVTYGSKRDFIW